jgi:hypothetical protein
LTTLVPPQIPWGSSAEVDYRLGYKYTRPAKENLIKINAEELLNFDYSIQELWDKETKPTKLLFRRENGGGD